MNRLFTSALCALSLAAFGHVSRAYAMDPAATPAPTGQPRWPHLEDASNDLAQAKTALAAAEAEHADKGTLGGHGAKASEHVDAAIKHIADAEAFAQNHPAKAGKHPGKVTAKERHHKARTTTSTRTSAPRALRSSRPSTSWPRLASSTSPSAASAAMTKRPSTR